MRRPSVIALVNNMPDAALRATEQQFRGLLAAAAGTGHEVELRLFSFPEIIRSSECRAYIAREYEPAEQLWSDAFDGLIVTGAEPRTSALPDEVYWPSLMRLVTHAMDSGTPAVWSCLAAHAAVLCLDGIQRRRLNEKLSGVFCCTRMSDDLLAAGLPPHWYLPHSRLNTLDAEPLERAGYEIVSCSAEAGVDTFMLHASACFVFYQGHPEYDPDTLFREYRRDVGRFLTGTMDRYPELPRGYVDERTASTLSAFREKAERDRTPDVLAEFPLAMKSPRHAWYDMSVQLYRNWLTKIVAGRRMTSAAMSEAAARAS